MSPEHYKEIITCVALIGLPLCTILKNTQNAHHVEHSQHNGVLLGLEPLALLVPRVEASIFTNCSGRCTHVTLPRESQKI